AAGIAGLIKTTLALKHGIIPPHVNFRELNPRIDMKDSPFVIAVGERAWPVNDSQTRMAAVSSFGLSGTNAHVVLEQAPAANLDHKEDATERAYLLPLSARSVEALHECAAAMHNRLQDATFSVGDLCYTAGLRRSHYEHRLAVVGSSIE